MKKLKRLIMIFLIIIFYANTHAQNGLDNSEIDLKLKLNNISINFLEPVANKELSFTVLSSKSISIDNPEIFTTKDLTTSIPIESKINNNQYSINTNTFSNGTYYLKININKEKYVKAFKVYHY